ncbi:hypothetical protein LTR37_002218 [Vermiconidia calcicola]|uniref:Uncharacterized protein n=1 Tax=Vermiconidia calcicola TaxID=1690605 RepID=A0ACC3NTF3_9PEZI|nr:hypothetical protein LTR37_002218 [Vermiconidia calcicola]
MAKAVADVTGENQGGFGSDGSDVMGFSGLHDLGVGYMPSLGNFPLFPITSCPNNDPKSCKFDRMQRSVSYRNDSVKARPGYFGIELDNGVFAEMTVTNHTALYRFVFEQTPADQSFGTVIYAGLEDLHSATINGFVSVNERSGRIVGNGTFLPSFGQGQYHAHFCADVGGADVIDTGVAPRPFSGDRAAGAWVQLASGKEVLVRVGLSFISSQQACKNAESEIVDFDFAKTATAAHKAWEDKFSVLEINTDGASEEMLTIFWTGVYRSFISPQDYTGENPLWNSDEPYFDSWYCIWDTFRTTHPLLVLLDQEAQTRMVRSLIDIYRHEGRLPDCRMSFCKGFTQGGSNADVVLADSMLKGISDNVDWNAGLEAVLADALEETRAWRVEGRGGVNDWKEYGYLPVDKSRGYHISRAVEYAYDDFCIAQMAKMLNNRIANEMLNRSHNWENLFNQDTRSPLPEVPAEEPGEGHVAGEDTGFTGFLQPRNKDGSFAYQDPALCSPLLNPNGCFLDYKTAGETYEGSVWLYTFLSSPSDMETVIWKLGGDVTFVRRLDYFHESGLLYFGDEQSFLTTYLYHYAGRPGLSGQRVRTYIPSIFNTSLNGLPGNDDSGAMGAFTALTMLGLFPNAGQDVYFIAPPFFKALSLKNKSTGMIATIKTVNFDGSHGQNLFIQSATLNGKPWTKSWLRHSFFLEGGTLELVLGPLESTWGQRLEDRPPSSGRDGSWEFMSA